MKWWKQFTVSALFAGVALALVVLPAAAADEVDQEASLLPPNGMQSWSGPDALRQSFKPAQDTLTSVDLYFESVNAATLGDVTVTMEVTLSGTVVGIGGRRRPRAASTTAGSTSTFPPSR